jgi:hypothetical protein
VRVYYATQPDVAPPTIVLFVNNPEMVSESYQRFMINRFRELLPYDEVPIKLVLRGRVKGTHEEEIAASEQRPAPMRSVKSKTASRKGKRAAAPRKARSRRQSKG